MKKNSYILEAQTFLKNNPDIKSFDIVMHDCNAIGRGKIIRRNELINIYKSGRQFPLSLMGMDITGEDVPETGLIFNQGDGDIKAWPIPSSLKYIHKSKIPCGALIIIIGNSYARFLPNFLNRIICKHDHLHLEKYLDNDDW